ncbi:uncharacterized protein BXIN_2040 [Babesia sp. Xinjiang]|uniref:uncharacterized protein n=1 Tax=Babesia sp. Xinjiang TaxID=462227 RepID=UPI000A251629|nr:uncharacterized protein BXIN_2040 [Babesia sp. Xinjiang]ORM40537.1 hypothetical protein BXIN_2040 [Babesia sp. Xinjiang]
MESFNSKDFLQCFDQLADSDALRRKQAVDRLLTTLALPSSVSEDKVDTSKNSGVAKGASNDKYKNPLSAQRSYQFRFTADGHNLLQYTIDRLLRGLKADRKCSRTGFTIALLSVLSLYGENVKKDVLLQAALAYTTLKDSAPSEAKDILCGRLYALFILHKSGVFRRPIATETLEKVFKSIWEAYDSKIYFQDAACVLSWLISRDLFRLTKDVGLTLLHIRNRLSVVLDRSFVEATFIGAKDKNSTGNRQGHDPKNTQIGKNLAGVLPCALFGLYLRLHNDIADVDKKLLTGTVLERSPLDEEYFSLVLRYVSCVPSNHPVIGSFFDVLVDSILGSDYVKDRLQQLWRSINLTMLDLKGGSSPQRAFSGLRLTAMLLMKVRHSPMLLKLLFMSGDNLFRLLCRYHNGPKGDPMKHIADCVMQLLVNICQGTETSATLEDIGNPVNPVVNDFIIHANMHRAFSENDPRAHVKMDEGANDKGVSSQGSCKIPLPEHIVADCLHSVASAVGYSAVSLTVFQNLFRALLRNSANLAATYSQLESMVVDIDISSNKKVFCWLLSMLQLSVAVAPKDIRIDLLKRFVTMNLLCISDANDDKGNITVTLGRLKHDKEELRILLVSNRSIKSITSEHHSPDAPATTNPEDGTGSNLPWLSKHMLTSSLASLSKTLQTLSHDKHEDNRPDSLRYSEVPTLTGVVTSVYDLLKEVANKRTVRIKPGLNGALPLVEMKDSKSHETTATEGNSKVSVAAISQKLMRCIMKLRKSGFEDENMHLISLYGSATALLLSLLEWHIEHLTRLSLGTVSSTEAKSLISEEKLEIIASFAESFTEAIASSNVSSDSVLGSMLSDSLLDTILSDDNSAAFGVVHSITKGLWNMSRRMITEDVREILLNNSLIHNESYDNSEFDIEESESDPEDDESSSASESDNDISVDHNSDASDTSEPGLEDDEEVAGLESDAEQNHDDSEGEYSNEEEIDSSGDSDESSTTPSTKRAKHSTVTDQSDEESDVELSGNAALDELLKDEEGNLEALRMERLKHRSLFELTSDSLKLMMRNLDLLQSCISDCILDPWYLQMLVRLHSSYQKSVDIHIGKRVGGAVYSVLGEYVSKIRKVFTEALRHVTRQPLRNSIIPDDTKVLPSECKVDADITDSDAMLRSLLDLTLQALHGQRLEKAAKYCRPQAVAVFVFAMQTELTINRGRAAVQTMMVLLVSLLSVSMCKNSRMGTNFFVQLSQRYPSAFARMNLVKLALESKVEFVQSELLSVCASAVTAIAKEKEMKPTRLCRRKCGKFLELIASDAGPLGKMMPEKSKALSFVTDNLLTSTLKSLPDLLSATRTKSETATASNETNKAGKRPLKAKGISPTLAKSIGRLLSSVIRPSALAPRCKTELQKVKDSLQNLLDVLDTSQGKVKHIQPLKAAMAQLNRFLDE